jgi:crotonobetainyl-CoA:carnitine CoA-transferase CaiB-like acyl-CoA transferase
MASSGRFSDGALAGVRILDLARVVAGPYVSRILGDMGAEVIKVEPPEGDQVRDIAPNFDRGMSAFFQWVNAGKRGLCIDMSKPAGVEVVRDLIRECDAVVENFRPGVLDRLGVGWDVIREINPRCILLSINGFGADSKLRERRSYAPIVHAVAGVLHDQAAYAEQPVAQINAAYADTNASLHATIALLAALRVAEATGVGQRIEVPLFDALLASYSEVNNALLPEPDDRTMNPIYQAGAHGAIAVAGPARLLWRQISQPNGLDDPAPPGAPLADKKRLRRQAIERWMAAQPSLEELLAALAEAGVACAPVVPIRDALHGDIAQERELLVEIDDRRGGTRLLVRPPARMSKSPNTIRGAGPRRGEHNREVLAGLLGYDEEKIAQLEREEILTAGAPDER